MRANGITSAVCNYTDKEQLTAAFHSTGAKLFFLITDFESAAKGKQKLEEQQGRDQIDAAKAAGFTTFDIKFKLFTLNTVFLHCNFSKLTSSLISFPRNYFIDNILSLQVSSSSFSALLLTATE